MSVVRRSHSLATLVAVCAAVMLTSRPGAYAQQTEEDPKYPVRELTLKAMPDLFPKGKAAVVTGKADPAGVGFVVSGLTMRTPVVVRLFAAKADAPLRLLIGKTWTEADRTGQTDAEGERVELLRTDDLAKIRVQAVSATAEFDLVVWVGDEAEALADTPGPLSFGQPEVARGKPGAAPAAGSAAAPASGSGSGAPAVVAGGSGSAAAPAAAPAAGGGGTSPVLYVIAGLLGVLVILVAVVVLRRKK